ncbi:ribonuclease H-like domain-containing protein [Nanoarchaeota archaeon]
MIKKSFIFLDRIGLRKEENLWKQGIKDWDDFVNAKDLFGFSHLTKAMFDDEIRIARKKLFLEEYDFFTNRMPQNELWRLYNQLKDECCFLDIETSGYYGDITVIGIYDGQETHMLVRGFNLNGDLLKEILSRYKMVVTFNGASFDLPIIKKYFQINFNQVHIDLRHVCSKLGYVGGLKKIEKEMGIKRADEVSDVSGADAVYLWQMWRSTGDREHLERLIQYNEEDIVNLKPIAERVIRELWSSRFGLLTKHF